MNRRPKDIPALPASSPSADQTRTALIRAALTLFGAKGFEGTSTREIAAQANANIGSIAYHFGGKEGLRTAAADYIVATIQGIAGQALGNFAAASGTKITPEAAHAQLRAALERMVAFVVVQPEAGEIVQFLLRELAHPTAALDRIYSGVFEPTHRRLCAMWEAATGEPAEGEETKLVVFTLIGQVVYFRIGREAVKRRMGWPEIGQADAAKIAAVAGQNLDAILNSRKGRKP
ncbi:CerR family C-terminal domain-containing protein [Mesorhizobium sp. CGMCC 1.15528]|uniref:CerR family C-terminal domain-containing protein n=1 Tax=Mesorhizobium zhangyense TaxID=1776730 RepID=A0A7C9RAH6_9HYPH|nr:CerR family C-terminal domain-containing protein [Mesorhizobium zhangyense]NGN44122.1 CerR family C-terminal domain-containing protein [Mesorhizobium zhangyense]